MQAGTFRSALSVCPINDHFPYLNKQINLWLLNNTRWPKIIPLELRLLVQSTGRNKFPLQSKWSVVSLPLSSSHTSLNLKNPQLVQSCPASCPVSAARVSLTNTRQQKPIGSDFLSINFVNLLPRDPDADASFLAQPSNALLE